MKVTVFPCGAAVNESESLAIEQLKTKLQNVGGTDEWILLTNLAFSVTHHFQSDEIDIIAIGPPGVRVIEVKHWSAGWVDSHPDLVEHECDKLTNKAKKIGTTLRRIVSDLGRVDGAMLLTQPPSKLKKLSGRQTRGVTFYSDRSRCRLLVLVLAFCQPSGSSYQSGCVGSLNQWKDVVGFDQPPMLSPQQIRSLSPRLEPRND